MNTPWGPINTKEIITKGFFTFDTPSHGGVAFSANFAFKNLSYAAIRRGVFYNNYLYYEEDNEWAIPLYELEKYWEKYFGVGKSKEEHKKELLDNLKSSSMDYIIEAGVDLSEEEVEHFKDYGENFKLTYSYNPNPDLIRNAINATIVTTEDGKIHYVTEDSYQKQRLNKYRNQSKYLSECKEIDPEMLQYPSNHDFMLICDGPEEKTNE